MSTKLVPLNEAKKVVALARETGNTDALSQLAAMGTAAQKWHLARGAREDALDAGEVYVRAMVALAEMDLEAAPNGGNKQIEGSPNLPPLADLEAHARAEWRRLATRPETGADLDDLIAYFREDEGEAGFSRAALIRVWTRLVGGGETEKSDSLAVHFSSATDEWATPQDLFDELNREFRLELDVCALPHNAKCEAFFAPEDDGLSQPWTGTCWMNPPYGDVIGDWVSKAHESAELGATVVCLLPARVDTGWWWDHCRHAEIRFLRGRLKFGDAANSAPFPSAVVIFGRPERVVWWER